MFIVCHLRVKDTPKSSSILGSRLSLQVKKFWSSINKFKLIFNHRLSAKFKPLESPHIALWSVLLQLHKLREATEYLQEN